MIRHSIVTSCLAYYRCVHPEEIYESDTQLRQNKKLLQSINTCIKSIRNIEDINCNNADMEIQTIINSFDEAIR